jgi:hypothetical protein
MQTHLKGMDSPARWRWHPLDGVWYSYSADKFILDDVGLPLTETPVGWRWKPPDEPSDAFWKYNDSTLADAFRNIEAAYGGFKTRYPHAVWNPRSGEWRAALRRTTGTGGHGHGDPSTSAQLRIANVRKAEAEGLITHEQATRLIEDILAESH